MPASRLRASWIALTALFLLGGACYDVPVSTLPAFLQPVAGARNVVARGDGYSYAVSYEITAPYPAVELLAAVERQIPAEWKPRTEDWLNPGIPTSHVRGWTQHGDATTSPQSSVHSWSSEWQNAAGDILSYHLRYRSPGVESFGPPLAAPTNETVMVLANVMASATIEELRASPPGAPAKVNWPLLIAALVLAAIGVLALWVSGRRTGGPDGH